MPTPLQKRTIQSQMLPVNIRPHQHQIKRKSPTCNVPRRLCKNDSEQRAAPDASPTGLMLRNSREQDLDSSIVCGKVRLIKNSVLMRNVNESMMKAASVPQMETTIPPAWHRCKAPSTTKQRRKHWPSPNLLQRQCSVAMPSQPSCRCRGESSLRLKDRSSIRCRRHR